MLLQLFNAFAIFMMRQKMMTINDAHIEAAVIDGASTVSYTHLDVYKRQPECWIQEKKV